jgi:hypothetical protein
MLTKKANFSKRSEIKQILNIVEGSDNTTLENNIISMPLSNYSNYKKEKYFYDNLYSKNFIKYYIYVFYRNCVKVYLFNNLYDTIINCLIISLSFTFIANNNRIGRYFEKIFNSVKGLGKQILNIS